MVYELDSVIGWSTIPKQGNINCVYWSLICYLLVWYNVWSFCFLELKWLNNYSHCQNLSPVEWHKKPSTIPQNQRNLCGKRMKGKREGQSRKLTAIMHVSHCTPCIWKKTQRIEMCNTDLKVNVRDKRDEWARKGGVCEWSFWVHSFMAGEALAPTWLYCQSNSS